MNRIVVVEDEEVLRGDLVDYLSMQGFEALGVGSRADLEALLKHEPPPQVLILDISLPDGDGFDIALAARETINSGIIMLTAHGDTESRVRGFESGADIYLVKHSSLREIAAAVQSLLRRMHREDAPGPDAWLHDPVGWVLTSPEGLQVSLTGTENAFVSALVESAGQALAREDLARLVSNRQTHFDNRHLDAVVSRLRRKILEQAHLEAPFKSVYGVGYTFSAPARTGSASTPPSRGARNGP
ncbi:response regulator transcription factor [Salipiger mucosus]|uniref:Response regulator n=1 Tax=Salipiger mucosus DSM 16094 TaxID=1123237 RepID=S9QWF3_9RHOB|nr:response regulator transcription factor [Salipiger mucosus]EPX83948.1 Response regulator [Salipiger mucosus DSM 16094]